jgi:D-amino-acid dehydrogenase
MADVIVLGAGIVGVSAALQLQKRGRSVAIIDRAQPGEGTSYGNVGLIQSEAFMPYTFPTGLLKLARYALNGEADAHYHFSSLLKIAPALFKYWMNASPERVERTIEVNAPLFLNAIEEHRTLAAEAGVVDLLREGGWMQLFRKNKSLDDKLAETERLKPRFGIVSKALDASEILALEPHLITDELKGGIHWEGPVSLRDPLQLTRAYLQLFVRRGGVVLNGDARSLQQGDRNWSVRTEMGLITAREAVVALGPWSTDVTSQFGYNFPLFVKRGYHMHYASKGNATLSRPVIDSDTGFALAAMTRGIRMTTGAEFAQRDAPATPVQVDRCEPRAKELYPLGERAEAEPWLGRRPVMPDMTPVIGPATRHLGLWFLFGHAHHGLTNAAVSGRLLAEMMTGETPFCDITGFRPDRPFV